MARTASHLSGPFVHLLARLRTYFINSNLGAVNWEARVGPIPVIPFPSLVLGARQSDYVSTVTPGNLRAPGLSVRTSRPVRLPCLEALSSSLLVVET